jgi:hypothetical protein
MGRFRVQLDLYRSPDLQRYFDFHWALVGNLGVDLLVHPLARLIGLEPAVKAIVLMIPPLTVGGLVWVAREIHGRVPPTVLFAVPFVYSYPFNYGFLNYSLSLALALIAFGFWLQLSRLGRLRLRGLIFIPISCALWIAHAFGWGVLGLLAFSAELIRFHDAEPKWRKAFVRAAINVAPLGLPLIIMVAGHGSVVGGPTEHFFDLTSKSFALVRTLRDRWLIWDSFGVAIGILVIGAAFFDQRLERSRRLVIPAVVLTIAFLAMPVRFLGLDYADVRLVPVIFLVTLPAIRARPEFPNADKILAWLGLAFVLLRLAGNSASFEMADRQSRNRLTALNHIPQGAPVLWLTGEYCGKRWRMPRHTHLGSFVIVRKQGFANGQWQALGAQLLRIRYSKAGYFQQERSGFIYSEECLRRIFGGSLAEMDYDHRLPSALRKFPRDAFDYVWMVDLPDFDMNSALPGLKEIWRGEDAILYRVEHKSDPSKY